MPNADKPVRDRRVVITNDHSGVVTALNPVNGKVFIINDVSRRILELSDGEHTTADIVQQLTTEFDGADARSIARDVDEFLSGCRQAELITYAQPAASTAEEA